MMRSWRVWIWVAVVLVLIALFNLFPRLAHFPALIVILPALVLLFYRFGAAKKNAPRSWHNQVYGRITALHCIYFSISVIMVLFAGLITVLKYVRDDPNELLYLAIIPAGVLALIAAITFGLGLYYARAMGHRD